MNFSGDDTYILLKLLQDTEQIYNSMRQLCYNRQERVIHGLGLVLKNPKISRYKGSMLSKNFGIYNGRVIITRMIRKLILTSVTQPVHLTRD